MVGDGVLSPLVLDISTCVLSPIIFWYYLDLSPFLFSEKAKRPLSNDYCFSSDVSCFNYWLMQKRPEDELHSQPVLILSLDSLFIFHFTIGIISKRLVRLINTTWNIYYLKWTYQHIRFGLISMYFMTYRRVWIDTYQYLFCFCTLGTNGLMGLSIIRLYFFLSYTDHIETNQW